MHEFLPPERNHQLLDCSPLNEYLPDMEETDCSLWSPANVYPFDASGQQTHYTGTTILNECDIMPQPTPCMKTLSSDDIILNKLEQQDDWLNKPVNQWTTDDVSNWIYSQLRTYHYASSPNINAFRNLTGNDLLSMKEEDFQQREPDFGPHLFHQFMSIYQPFSPQQLESGYATLQPVPNTFNGVDIGNYYTENVQQALPSFGLIRSHQQPAAMTNFDAPPPPSMGCTPFPYEANPEQTPCGGMFNGTPRTGGYPPSPDESLSDTPSDTDVYPAHENHRRPVGRPRKAEGRRSRSGKRCGRLWEFIRDLLKNPRHCPSLVRWEDHSAGTFRFMNSEKVAKLWGTIKNNPRMTYEKLSRAMRYYYRTNVLQPVLGRRLVYKFGPNAVNWICENPNFQD